MKKLYYWYNEKQNRRLYGKRGTKMGLARDLIIIGDIKISKSDLKWLDLKHKKELHKITERDAAELLERKGWIWVSDYPIQ